MTRRRFHRISYAESNTYYSFNPERIETVHMSPGSEDNTFQIRVVMGSGTEHNIIREDLNDALSIFCSLSGAPPPTTEFDDLRKSYFPQH
jgi:hypothetical protein